MTEPLTPLQMKQLMANLNPSRVAHRKQGGANLSYLEAWDVRATMTRIFGFGGWSAELLEGKVLRIDEVPSSKDPSKSNFRVLAQSTVRVIVHQLGAVYSDSAAASQTGPDIGEVTDFSLKTSASDAFKRACMNLGTQFSLSLYDNGSMQDVIKVVLAPGQHETLEEVRHPKPKPGEDSQVIVNPTTGEVVPVPGEDPADDAAMALVPPEPSPASRASALDAVRGGFDRNGRG